MGLNASSKRILALYKVQHGYYCIYWLCVGNDTYSDLLRNEWSCLVHC